jgi:hypothetical protein
MQDLLRAFGVVKRSRQSSEHRDPQVNFPRNYLHMESTISFG